MARLIFRLAKSLSSSPPPVFVSADSKGLNFPVSSLDPALAGVFASVDSKGLGSKLSTRYFLSYFDAIMSTAIDSLTGPCCGTKGKGARALTLRPALHGDRLSAPWSFARNGKEHSPGKWLCYSAAIKRRLTTAALNSSQYYL